MAVEFEWNGEAVKSLCGQGDLCICLRCDFSKFVPVTSDESNDTAEAAVEAYNTIRPHLSSAEIQRPSQNSSSGSLPLSQVFAATNDDVKPGPSSMVDLMCTSPGNTPMSFLLWFSVSNLQYLLIHSVQLVDVVANLCNFDTELAMNYLVSGPTAGGLLQLLR